MVCFCVIFEAPFAEVQGGESAHAECAFFAVVAWTQATEKLENAVNRDERSQQEYHASRKSVQQQAYGVERNPYGEGKIAGYYKVFGELYGFADYSTSLLALIK
jgi:hypothetical protein